MINYKHKYIKYKQKYLNYGCDDNMNTKFKNKSRNDIDLMIGGTMNVNLIKELGSGGNGTAYLVVRNGEKLVYKLERLDEYTEPLTSEYYRQIDFDEKIARENKDKFMILKAHGMILDCDYVQPNTGKMLAKKDEVRKERFIRKNKQPHCYFLLYSPYLDGRFRDIKREIQNNEILMIDFIYQIITSIDIMRNKGFSQNDIAYDNIMYKEINNTYEWYIIDYGNITNVKYPDSLLDKEKMKNDPTYKKTLITDIIGLIKLCVDESIYDFIKEHKIERKDNLFQEKFKESEIYKDIAQYMPESITDEKRIGMLERLATMIKYPVKYVNYIGISKEICDEYVNKQLFADLLLECLKHCNDDNYGYIINKIKMTRDEVIAKNKKNMPSPIDTDTSSAL